MSVLATSSTSTSFWTLLYCVDPYDPSDVAHMCLALAVGMGMSPDARSGGGGAGKMVGRCRLTLASPP